VYPRSRLVLLGLGHLILDLLDFLYRCHGGRCSSTESLASQMNGCAFVKPSVGKAIRLAEGSPWFGDRAEEI
jgi:hypothetical protein